MKKPVVSAAMLALLLAASFSPSSYAQAPAQGDTPTFYHLVPGTYVNGWPRFTIHYPKDWVERHPWPSEVFRASAPGPVPYPAFIVAIPANPYPPDKLSGFLVRFLGAKGKDVTVVTDKPVRLRDGTPAQEIEIHLVMNGAPLSTVNLATIKGDVGVTLAAESLDAKIGEDLKAILYSIEFQPGFDEPVKLPPDVQAFIDTMDNAVVSHDLEKVMSHYSDRFLGSGVRKGEVEQQWRFPIGGITSQKSVVTDFIAAGDRAYLAGFWDMKPFGRVPLRESSIIKENGEWKWYGNQIDVAP